MTYMIFVSQNSSCIIQGFRFRFKCADVAVMWVKVFVSGHLSAPLSVTMMANKQSPPPPPQHTHTHTHTRTPLHPPSTLPRTPSAPSYQPSHSLPWSQCVCVCVCACVCTRVCLWVLYRERMNKTCVFGCMYVHRGVSWLLLMCCFVPKGGCLLQ